MGIERPKKDSLEKKYPKEIYEIKVYGYLDNLWSQWFDGMTITIVDNGEDSGDCTIISGPVSDQAQLHGLLIKIRDLNLELLSVRRVNPSTNHGEEVSINLE